MSDLTLGTPVVGSGEPIGRLTGLVCHPTTREITHLVVNADDVPGSDRLVPIDRLAACDTDRLTLAMSRHQFFRLKTLETVRLLPGGAPDVADVTMPSRTADAPMTFALHEQIPRWDLALRRGTRVEDRRGHRLGHLHSFVVDPASHDVTHLTLQQGHLLGRRDVTIPVAEIAAMTEDVIRLRNDGAPTHPCRHRGRWLPARPRTAAGSRAGTGFGPS